MSSATRKIALNTAAQVAGRVIVMILAAASVAILTRYLGPAGYGNFTLALVYVSFFGIVADLGLFTIAVREMSKDERRTQEIVANTLSLRALLSFAVFSLAIAVGWLLPYELDVKIAIAIAATSQVFGLLNSSLITVFQTKLRMGRSVVSDVIGRAAALGAVIYVAAQDLGFFAVVGTAALGSLVTMLVSIALARRFVKVRFYADRQLWKLMLKESLPLGATLVVATFYYRVNILLLSFMRTPVEVGVYGAVFKILEMLTTLPGFFVNSVFPVLVKRQGTDPARAIRSVQKAFDFLVISGVPFAAGGLILAPDLMRLIGGAEFVSGADALRLTLVTMIFSFVLVLFGALYVSKGKQLVALKIVSIGLVLNLVGNLALIPTFGIVGSALATLASEAVIFGLYLWGSRKQLATPINLRIVPRTLLAAGLMVAAMLPFRAQFWIAFLVGSTAYVILALALRLVSRDVLRELLPKRP